METIELEVSLRSGIGSGDSGRQRKSGKLPAVVYQPGGESLSVLLNSHDFTMAARGKPHTQLFKFKGIDSLSGKMSLVKSVQSEPIKGKLLHVEFLAVSDDHKVVVSIPVSVTGVPACVKLGTATVNQSNYELEVACFPTKIPNAFVLDISNMEAGDSIHASDVPLPEGVVLKSIPGLTIVTATMERKVEESAAAVTAATPAKAAPVKAAAPKK